MTPQAEALMKRIEHEIAIELARDRRNRAVIDRMKQLNARQKLAVQFRKYPLFYLAAVASFVLLAGVTLACAEELPHPVCPDLGVPCKVLYLNQQEEQVLMRPNGVLDTAAQGRALELGQFSVYFKGRVATAPAGEIKAPEKPKPADQPAVAPTEDKPN